MDHMELGRDVVAAASAPAKPLGYYGFNSRALRFLTAIDLPVLS
jgi:hypothetical protein